MLEGSGTLILVDFSRVGPSIQLSWQSIIGKVYQVQFSGDPNQGAWSPLGSNLTAASSTLSITDTAHQCPVNTASVYLISRTAGVPGNFQFSAASSSLRTSRFPAATTTIRLRFWGFVPV